MASSTVNAAFDRVLAVVTDRLSRNVRIRRTLPGGGRLRLDRQLPFLCIYRYPPGSSDEGARELVTTEAAYLFASGEPQYAEGIERLCRHIRDTLVDHFGEILFIELWTETPVDDLPPSRTLARPAFRIVASPTASLDAPLAALEAGLREVRLHGSRAEVAVERVADPTPPRLPPIAAACHGDHCSYLGVEVHPIFRDPHTGAFFPIVLQSLRRQLAVAIRQAVFAFTGREAPHNNSVAHFEALGPSAIAKAGRQVDQELSEIAQSFDFLLQATPVNSEAAWEAFQASHFRKPPVLFYRPLPYHPAMLKRQLYSIPLEHVEDATLAHLFEQKQDELGHQLDALKHIGTRAFFYDSLQLHGKPDAELVDLADDILAGTDDFDPPCDAHCAPIADVVTAARDHIDYYHERLPDFHAKVELTAGIASALMVAKDQLFISETAAIRPARIDPLMHHEVGTHLLTYFNGRQQPLRQLYAGFAGYEALQEGLAVLAEYMVGGLSVPRLRTLAARVLAVHAMVEGVSFIDAFDLLHRDHKIGAKTAFMTALRAHRGGGLAKDALYLRGLRDLLAYLSEGHDLEPLYVGKISLEHVPLVQELRRRDLVQPPALLPRFWEDPTYDARLQRCRESTLLDLLEPVP